MAQKFICKRCKMVDIAGCPIFEKRGKDFGVSGNIVDTTIYATVDAVGCKYTDVVDNE